MSLRLTNAKRTNFYLPQQQLDLLDAWSVKTGLSRSEMLRRAIDYYALAIERASGTNRAAS